MDTRRGNFRAKIHQCGYDRAEYLARMCFVFLGVLCPTTCMFTASCIRKKWPHSCLRPRHEPFLGTFSSGDTSANTPAGAVRGATASSLTQGLREFMGAEQLCVGLDHCPYVNMISLFRRRRGATATPQPRFLFVCFYQESHSGGRGSLLASPSP